MTREQHEWIVDNVEGVLAADLTRLFNERFQTDLKANQLRAYKKNHKLSSGVSCRFITGHVSHNKGKKIPKRLQSTKSQFKKGHIPHNNLVVGSEILSTDGYLKVKMADPNIWEFKHKLVYRQHKGEIPEGHVVIFADGDHLNVDIENLVAIPKPVLLTMNRKGLFQEDADLTKTGIVIANVLTTVYQAERKAKE
jgi:hypothetical protein